MAKILKNYQFFCAVAVLIGTIVGAGTFGLPYVMAQAGFGLGLFYLIILTGAVTLIHLSYGEIVLRTEQSHRLVGYAEKYLGRGAKTFAAIVLLFEYYGSLLAYIILGGEFLRIIFSRFLGGSETFWVLVFFALGMLAILFGLRFVSNGEFFMMLALVGLMAALVIKGWPLFDGQNLIGANWANWLLPYGVILFALAGSVAVPEMRQALKGQERKLKTAIFLGTVIPAVLYLVFVLAVVGISGSATSEDAISGLVPYFGPWIVQIGAIFGLLAVYTSFIVVGLSLKNIYRDDYHLSEGPAFFLICAIPLAAYLAGIKSFILVIGFVGAIMAGLDGILTIAIYLKAKKNGDRRPEYSLSGAKTLGLFLILIFTFGIVINMISFFTNK